MNTFLIITEGVIALVAVITLAIAFFKGALSLESRIARLETKVEPFWDSLRQVIGTALLGITPKGNPIAPERWQYLVNGLRANALTTQEAQELHVAMLEQQEEAKKKNDQTALIILGLGIALLAILLSSQK